MQSLTYPNGTSWTFQYTIDGNADLSRITFPNGGTTSYTWVQGPNFPSNATVVFSRAVTTRVLNDNISPPATWNYGYVYTPPAGSFPVATTTVTDPQLNDTVHTYTGPQFYETLTQFYQGSKSSGSLVKTIQTDFPPRRTSAPCGNYQPADSVLPLRVTTSWANGQTTKVETDYDSSVVVHCPLYLGLSNGTTVFDTSVTVSESNGRVTATREYDYGPRAPGPLLRTTSTSYLWQSNSSYLTANLLNTPNSITLRNGAGTQAASTIHGYDENNGSPQGILGNPTSIGRWLNSTGAYLTSKSILNAQGMATQSIDPLSNATKYTYDSTGTFVIQIQRPDTTANNVAIHHIVNYTHDPVTGETLTFRDENSNQTSYSYDSIGRRTAVTLPDGGQTTTCYTDEGGPTCTKGTPPYQMVTSSALTSATAMSTTTSVDGLERVIRTLVTSDPDCPSGDRTDTTYDSLGRVHMVSNPYCTTSDSTYGLTSYAYDALGRVTKVIPPDGSATSNNVTISYSGNATTVTDQAGHSRKSATDGFGRLTVVWEDPAGLNYQTSYGYDVLNNLTSVVQNGSRPRTFTYDSLSRLLTSTNPESGTISYAYDANGNLLTKLAPLPNQIGTATVITTYAYDALHRLTGKTYSDGTPAANFYFDAAPSFWAGGEQNTVGRLVEATTSNTATEFSYDPVGRIGQRVVCTPLTCTVGPNGQVGQGWSYYYTYNLAGEMTQFNDGVYTWPQSFNQTFDGAGRVTQVTSSVSDAQHPATFFTADATNGYFPNGALRKATLGNGLTLSNVYDKRLQPCLLDVANNSALLLQTCNDSTPTGNVLDLYMNYNLGVNDNGNVVGWNATGAQSYVRTYNYDALNRVKTMADTVAAQPCKGLSWTYDAWGNRTDQAVTSGTCGTFHQGVDTNNRFVGAPYQYDAAGNMTHDASHSYAYDAENRVKSVDGGATATYIYDAFGRRAKRTVGANSYEYVYDLDGNIGWELLNGSVNHAYIRSNGRLLAEYFEGTTYFVHADHLGSTRLLTRLDKSVRECDDYYPYGESNACGVTTGTPLKFTSKERDPESGLDNFGARYDSSTMGRFMSPDPVMVSWRRMVNPQVWNAYSYAGNNPLRYVDPTGEELVQLGQHTDDEIKKRQKEIKQELKNKDLSKDEKDALKKERNTLGLEQQGNHVVAGLLADLDKTGQRNGLQLSNFTLSTDTKNDFAAGHPDAGALQKLLGAQAFVLQGNKQFGGTIYIRTEPETGFYQMSQGNSDFGYYGASALRHEQEHLNGGGEYPAFQRQLSVFEGFQSFFQNPALYRGLNESIREGIKANQP